MKQSKNPKIHLHQEHDFCKSYSTLFHWQPVYKQLVLGWKIAKQQEGSTLFNLATIKTAD